MIFFFSGALILKEKVSSFDFDQIACKNSPNSIFGELFKNDEKYVALYGTKNSYPHSTFSIFMQGCQHLKLDFKSQFILTRSIWKFYFLPVKVNHTYLPVWLSNSRMQWIDAIKLLPFNNVAIQNCQNSLFRTKKKFLEVKKIPKTSFLLKIWIFGFYLLKKMINTKNDL